MRTPSAALFCLPDEGVKNWLGAKAVVDFADAHPELLGLVETEFAIRAMAAKYPCAEL
jgi:hypothetical protein